MPFQVFQISPGSGWTFRLEDDAGTAYCQSVRSYDTQAEALAAVEAVQGDGASAEVLVQIPGQEPEPVEPAS